MQGNRYVKYYWGIHERKFRFCVSLGVGAGAFILIGLQVILPNQLPPSHLITGIGVICLMVGVVLMIPLTGMIKCMTTTVWRRIRAWVGWQLLRNAINWEFFLPQKPLGVSSWNDQVAINCDQYKPLSPEEEAALNRELHH